MNFPNCNRGVYLDSNGFSIWLINEPRSCDLEEFKSYRFVFRRTEVKKKKRSFFK